MNYQRKLYNGEEFIHLTIEPVIQKENTFYLAKIPANQLIDIYTVRPAEYDIKKHEDFANTFVDEKDYYNHLTGQSKEKLGKKDFQRNYDKGRVKRISNFINENDYPFFPNTIIANCDLINNYQDIGIDQDSSIDEFLEKRGGLKHLSFLYRSDNETKLLIPYLDKTLLIIDGQHRLEGLKGANIEITRSYEVVLSLLLGYDRSIIAKQFYTINYEQKSVNKSLLYQLTGEFSTEIDHLTFLHNVVKILNEVEGSPFHNRIKMLGVNPKAATMEEKKMLSLSQAFLIDWLMKTISSSSKNSLYQPIFLHQFRNKSKHADIIVFLKKYFQAIKELKTDWNDPENSILSKGMGVGALIRVMHFLCVKMYFDDYDQNADYINLESIDSLKQKLRGIERVDFTEKGSFKGVGSAGSVNKIKEALIVQIDYFGFDSYSNFISHYKQHYQSKFEPK